MTDVQELRALLDAAQVPGPAVVREAETWAYGGYALVAVVVFSGGIPLAACGNPDLPRSRNVGDLIAAAVNALPELLDEVERLRIKADAADALQTEAARLRSDLDVERAQSAEFVREIERLKAAIADAERWAAHSAAGEAAAIGVIKRAVSDMLRIPVSIEALAVSAIRQSLSDFRPSVAGSRMLDEVERLRARRAEMCECVKCGGSGGVVVEGEK